MQHYTGQAFTDAAKPAGGATITVKIAGTNNNAIIYSDDGVTVKSNPFSADSFGHFDFYAASGKYDITLIGSQITTTTLPNQVLFDPFEQSAVDAGFVSNNNVPLNSSGQGGFWGGSVFYPHNAFSATSGIVFNANEVRAIQFVLPFRTQIGKVSYNISNGAAFSTGDVGIYDLNGNRLASTGGFSTAATTTVSTPLLNGPITLNAGFYYFCWTNSSTSVGMLVDNFGTGGNFVTIIFQASFNSKTWGVANNAANSGVLPASLGGVFNNTNVSAYPICYFER